MEIRFYTEAEDARDDQGALVKKTFAKFEKTWKHDVHQAIGGKVTAKEAAEYPIEWEAFLAEHDASTFENIPGVTDV